MSMAPDSNIPKQFGANEDIIANPKHGITPDKFGTKRIKPGTNLPNTKLTETIKYNFFKNSFKRADAAISLEDHHYLTGSSTTDNPEIAEVMRSAHPKTDKPPSSLIQAAHTGASSTEGEIIQHKLEGIQKTALKQIKGRFNEIMSSEKTFKDNLSKTIDIYKSQISGKSLEGKSEVTSEEKKIIVEIHNELIAMKEKSEEYIEKLTLKHDAIDQKLNDVKIDAKEIVDFIKDYAEQLEPRLSLMLSISDKGKELKALHHKAVVVKLKSIKHEVDQLIIGLTGCIGKKDKIKEITKKQIEDESKAKRTVFERIFGGEAANCSFGTFIFPLQRFAKHNLFIKDLEKDINIFLHPKKELKEEGKEYPNVPQIKINQEKDEIIAQMKEISLKVKKLTQTLNDKQ